VVPVWKYLFTTQAEAKNICEKQKQKQKQKNKKKSLYI